MNFIRLNLYGHTRWTTNQKLAQLETKRLIYDVCRKDHVDPQRWYQIYAKDVIKQPVNVPTDRKSMLAWLRENVKHE